jgi:hypothetical protein
MIGYLQIMHWKLYQSLLQGTAAAFAWRDWIKKKAKPLVKICVMLTDIRLQMFHSIKPINFWTCEASLCYVAVN